MHLFQNNKWESNFLDEFVEQDKIRLNVLQVWAFHKIENIYFTPVYNINRLFLYIRRYGWIAVWRKIISRNAETGRNQKFMTVGLAIESTDINPKFYFFVNPIGSAAQERIVLNKDLIIQLNEKIAHQNELQYVIHEDKFLYENFKTLEAWSPFSGINLPNNIESLLSIGLAYYRKNFNNCKLNTYSNNPSIISEFTESKNKNANTCILAYGNHTKTMIIPNLNPGLVIGKIHEIDTTQIGNKQNKQYSFDTSPHRRHTDVFPYYFIATYHHLHAPFAVDLLQKKAKVCIEKPPVTNRQQASQLLEVIQLFPNSLFLAYNYRYHPFNELIRKDLNLLESPSFNYYCIVYESKLPKYHWYNWPNSGSRIISNACHWIDHFLFLNNFEEVKTADVTIYNYENIHLSLILKNNSNFSMILTNEGSNFAGVEDHIELRSGEVSICIDNLSIYHSKNNNGNIQKVKSNKIISFEKMYQMISGAMLQKNKTVDTTNSIQSSINTILLLEEIFQEKWLNFQS